MDQEGKKFIDLLYIAKLCSKEAKNHRISSLFDQAIEITSYLYPIDQSNIQIRINRTAYINGIQNQWQKL